MLLVLRFVVLLIWAAPAAFGSCPAGYVADKNGCYFVSTEKGNVSECQHRICAGIGGTLASIGYEALNNMLLKLVTVGIDRQPAFIGLFERGEDESGDWVWADGFQSNFTMWATGEPNNWCLDEDCATLGSGGEFGGGDDPGWYDVSCSETRRCICQLGGAPTDDFIQKEANMTNVTAEGTYEQCLAKTKQCWWYENQLFQYVVIFIGIPCVLIMVYALVATLLICLGYGKNPNKVSIREYVSDTSLYGGLLSGNSRSPGASDDFIDRWIVRGAYGEILYAVALFLLACSTFLHMNRGISFGFGIDTLEASAMFLCKLVVALSVALVHWKLSPLARAVVTWWVLVLASSKALLAVCTLMLAIGYATATRDGGMGTFCSWGYHFCWTLVLSLVFECFSALALCRLQQRAVEHAGDPRIFSRVVGCSWLLLVAGTLGAGLGLGLVAALFVFDDPHDRFSPYRAFGFFYLGAAACQLVAGTAMLRANLQIRAHFASAGALCPEEAFDTRACVELAASASSNGDK